MKTSFYETIHPKNFTNGRYKLFVMCDDYYKFEIYTGQDEKMSEEPDLSSTGNVVVRLT